MLATPSKDVIDEYYNKLIQIRSEHSIHQSINIVGALVNPNDITKKLVVSIPRGEYCFCHIRILYSYLMTPRSQVNIRINCRYLKLVEQIINHWQWICILTRHFIQQTIVNTHSYGPVLLT